MGAEFGHIVKAVPPRREFGQPTQARGIAKPTRDISVSEKSTDLTTPGHSVIPLKPRFQSEVFHQNPSAPLRHFQPITTSGNERSTPRDRFGNCVYTSPIKSYKDREFNETKAAMLVSREGEEFIRQNPGILNDIDLGLTQITSMDQSDSPLQTGAEVELGRQENGAKKRTIKKLFTGHQGNQSLVYLLEIGSEKYVIKKHTSKNDSGVKLTQPYINEMLQTQSLAADLQTELAAARVEMPTYIFATGQVSCAKFVEGIPPTEKQLENTLQGFLASVTNYIADQQSDLWSCIHTDAKVFLTTPATVRYKTDNFIQRADGSMVWVDPVFYDPFDTTNHQRRILQSLMLNNIKLRIN